MNKTRHRRTAVASMFKNDICRITKCSARDGFRGVGHNYCPWCLNTKKALNSYCNNSLDLHSSIVGSTNCLRLLKQIHKQFGAFEPFWCKWHECTPLVAIHYCPWLLHTQKALNSYYSNSSVFKIQLCLIQFLFDSWNKSTSNLEHLQHSAANGIIVQPC